MMVNIVPEWLKPYIPSDKLPVLDSPQPKGGLEPKHPHLAAKPKELKPVGEARGKHFADPPKETKSEEEPENPWDAALKPRKVFSEVISQLSSMPPMSTRDQALGLLEQINESYEDTTAWMNVFDEDEILVEWAKDNRRVQFDFEEGEDLSVALVTFTSPDEQFSVEDFVVESMPAEELLTKATDFLFNQPKPDDLFDGLTLDL